MASHFVGELIGKYKLDRPAIPAIAPFDLACMTAIANDMGYENVFVRQLEALANPFDVLIALSTSGKSKNINNAIGWATRHGMYVIELRRRGKDTPSIQENQLKDLHKLAGLIEEAFP